MSNPRNEQKKTKKSVHSTKDVSPANSTKSEQNKNIMIEEEDGIRAIGGA